MKYKLVLGTILLIVSMFLVVSMNVPPVHAAAALDSGCTGSNSATSGTTVTVSSLNCAASDVIIVMATTNGGSSSPITVSSISSTPTLTWSTRGSVSGVSSRAYLTERYAAAGATAVTSITVTFSGSLTGDGAAVIVFGVSGANTASPFDTHAGLPYSNDGSSSTPSVTGVSTSTANDAIIAVLGSRSTTAETAGSGFTMIVSKSTSTSGGNGAAEYEIASGTLTSATVSFGTSVSDWAMLVDAIQPVAQYSVVFTSSGISSDTGTNTVVTINGVNYQQSQLPFTAQYTAGSSITYAFASTVNTTVTNKEYGWSSTSGLSQTLQSNTFTVTAGGTVTGTYNTEYYLRVRSAQDSPTGAAWYNSGTSVSSSVTSPVSGGTGIQYVSTGWTGTGSAPTSGSGTSTGSFTITAPSSVTWNWKTQYQLTMAVSPSSPAGGTTTPAVGQSWQDAGTVLTISASAGGGYSFSSWTGSGTGSYTGTNNPATSAVTMSAPITETANFATGTTIFIHKTAVGGDAKFNFTATGSGMPGAFSITTSGGSGGQTFSSLVAGAYTVIESGPSSPWTFTSLTCSAGTVVGQSVSITLTTGQSVTCTYTDTKTAVLTVSVNPTGAGTVNLNPSQPGGGYVGGTVVQATPQASSGYYFIGWALDGGYAGTTTPLSVTMDNNHALTAYFQSEANLWPKYYNINYGYSIGPTSGQWDQYAVYGGRPFTINDTNRPSWLSTFCNSQPCNFGLIYTGDQADSGVGRAIGLAVSADGFTWYKYANQILTSGTSGSWDDGRVANGQVIWDGSQWVMYYTGRSATTGFDAVGRATSTDLQTWTRYAGNPVLARNVNFPNEGNGPVHPLVIKTGANAYMLWYTAPHPDTGISYIYLASSINGITWVRQNSGNPVFSPSADPNAWDSSLVYFQAVIYNSGSYTMFYSGCSIPYEGTICRIGYATSPDGISWSRASDNPIVAQDPANSLWPASWDTVNIKDPGVAVFNGRIMVYYTGNDYAIGIAMQPVGTIVINKIAINGDAKFNFTSTGGNALPASFSITTTSGSVTQIFNNIAPGAYSVTETGPSSPWSFTALSCSSGGSVSGQTATISSLAAGQTVTCTYTDTKATTGSIVIQKTAVGGDAQFNFTATGTSMPASFSITTVSGSGSLTFSSLSPGAYSVTETGPSSPWLFTSLTCSSGGSASNQAATISLSAGSIVTCTYTDSKVAGIVIYKTAVGGDAQFNFTATGTSMPASFSITTASGSGSQTFSGLAPGSYSVTETGPSSPWSFTSLSCSAGGSVSGQTATITLTAGQAVTCTYTDTKAGTITINKSAVGGNAQFNFTATGGLTTPFSITTVSGSGSQTFSSLSPGAYSVTETGPSSPWLFTSLTCSSGGGSVSGQTATITLTAGQAVTCTYTDTKAGTITINKSAVGGNAQFNFTATGTSMPQSFSITSVSGSGSSTFSNLVAGSYTVTEVGPSSPWLFTMLSCSAGGSVSGQTATITLTAGQAVTCTYTDTKAATVSIATTLNATSIGVGKTVHDSAVLTGATGSAGGTVTYSYFAGGSCGGSATQVGSPVTVVSGVVPDSASVTFGSAGSYSWNAVYSGDGNNIGATSACEPLTVVPPTSMFSVVRGTDNGIYWNQYTGSSWVGWSQLPGATLDGPGAVQCGGQLYLAVQGTDNGIYFGSLNTGTKVFSGWSQLPGGATLSGPGLAADSSCNLFLAVRGTDNGVYLNTYTSGSWHAWSQLPGATKAGPGVAVTASTIYLAVRGTDDAIYFSRVTRSGMTFNGWTSVGGATKGRPGLAAVSDSEVYMTVGGTDNGIYLNKWNGGGWAGWATPAGGATLSGPGLIATGGKLYLMVHGTDNGIYWSSGTWSGSWSAWSNVGGATPSSPTLA